MKRNPEKNQAEENKENDADSSNRPVEKMIENLVPIEIPEDIKEVANILKIDQLKEMYRVCQIAYILFKRKKLATCNFI